MNIKKYCQQPRFLVKARHKYPCISTALIAGIFISLLFVGSDGIAAKYSSNSLKTSKTTIAPVSNTSMVTQTK